MTGQALRPGKVLGSMKIDHKINVKSLKVADLRLAIISLGYVGLPLGN